MMKYIPNSFNTLGGEWFVSQAHPRASDNNPGTEDSPFKTISKAAAVMGRYDEVVIDDGIYREEIPLLVNGHEYVPEHVPVFCAASGASVSIKGSDVFTPDWEKIGDSTFSAPLPAGLFEPETYNPYELSAFIDHPDQIVRPCGDQDIMPPTLGQLFLNGVCLRQVRGEKELIDNSWFVSADGTAIVARFEKGFDLENAAFELTVRKRCFAPKFTGLVFISVRGIDVDHAAEPGPFCRSRRETLRFNGKNGFPVRKTFNLFGTTTRQCRLFTGEVSYTSVESDKLSASVYDESAPGYDPLVYDVESNDDALTWVAVSETRKAEVFTSSDLFLDEDLDRLVKTEIKFMPGAVPEHGCNIVNRGKTTAVSSVSTDAGKNWLLETEIGLDLIPFRIIKLLDGSLLLPCGKNEFLENGALHQSTHFFKGRWNDLGGIDWELISSLRISPDESLGGLSEPHVAEFADGRLMTLFRMGAVVPSDERAGKPSVKLFSVSEDGGVTWSSPKALTWDDGGTIYSPRSYQDLFRSRKNNRVYAVINISEDPTVGCDPRSSLHIFEIDPISLKAKQDTVSLIDEKHDEEHGLVRFSNWLMFESRTSGNLIILMRKHMSEFCPIRFGYDLSSYRYEVCLPTSSLEDE